MEVYNDLMFVFNVDEFTSCIIVSLYDQDVILRNFLNSKLMEYFEDA